MVERHDPLRFGYDVFICAENAKQSWERRGTRPPARYTLEFNGGCCLIKEGYATEKKVLNRFVELVRSSARVFVLEDIVPRIVPFDSRHDRARKAYWQLQGLGVSTLALRDVMNSIGVRYDADNLKRPFQKTRLFLGRYRP